MTFSDILAVFLHPCFKEGKEINTKGGRKRVNPSQAAFDSHFTMATGKVTEAAAYHLFIVCPNTRV